MERIHFTARIRATREKVWDCLWSPCYYETWVSAFMEGSTVKTDNWKEGSKIYFHDGYGSGMVSSVAASRPPEFMSFKHLGVLKDGVEDTTSEQVSAWAGAMENYTLSAQDGETTLQVEMDITADFKDYMMKTWPLALEKIKGLAEGTVKPVITVKAEVNVPLARAWETWTGAGHLMQWNHASDDWHCPAATLDVRTGGLFSATMAAKDGSFSFDFGGVYTDVKDQESIHATLGDGRMWKTLFRDAGDKTIVTERFEAESTHPLEMQQGGWQAILNNYKKYTETI